jgi:PIN domain nuclease of toxin-antitoxin system
MNNNKIVLDTHILIWSLLTPDNLANETKQIISEAQNNNNLFISSISLWEIAMLIERKRISLYERSSNFLNSITNIDGLNIIQINANIATESVALPGNFSSDPADCIIIASTRELAGTLITRDNKIIEWAQQGFLKFHKG